MSLRRVQVVLRLPHRIPDLIPHCTGIIAAMTDNEDLPDPTPKLAVAAEHVADLAAAHSAYVINHARPMLGVRESAHYLVLGDMHQLKAYVQRVVDADLGRAATIISGAGMFERRFHAPQKQTFSLERGEVSGQVLIYAPFFRDAAYEWQHSPTRTDWIDLPPTRQSSTSVEGLPPLEVRFFRHRILTRRERSDWSAPLSILVL